MSPDEITEANWVQALESYLFPEPSTLTASIRENLDLGTQHTLREMRETLPTITVNGREVSDD